MWKLPALAIFGLNSAAASFFAGRVVEDPWAFCDTA
jgi:hypothetical protein